MNSLRAALAITSLVACATVLAAEAPSGPPLRRDAGVARVPLNSRWEQLTPEQRDKVRASYQGMGPADEPPYPLEGMAPLMQKLQKGAELFKVSGQVDMAIEIAADGSPHDVTVYSQAGTAQFTQFVASVLAMTRYKPGVCGGHACTMAFPLQVTFSRG